MEKAIKIAIENGWKPLLAPFGGDDRVVIDEEVIRVYEYFVEVDKFNLYQTLLDPLFWQALGKGLGWSIDPEYCTSGCGCAYPNGDGSHEFDCVWKRDMNWWGQYWHEFIDHLAEGKDINSFFNDLTQGN